MPIASVNYLLHSLIIINILDECMYEELKDGIVIQRENRVAALEYFQCGSGSVLVGSPIRQCLSNGGWSGTKPLCKRKNSTHSILYNIKCTRFSVQYYWRTSANFRSIVNNDRAKPRVIGPRDLPKHFYR